MAIKAKKLFSKYSLRLGSMFLAVLMLVLSAFTGIIPIKTQADITEVHNVLQLVTDKAYVVGQNVILDVGKTYSFSYYYEKEKFVPGQILDGNDAGDTKIAISKTVYDNEYNKVTYEFVAPSTATSAGEGKVRIYLGLQKKTDGVPYHFYGFDVHAVDDETKTNLFNDPYFNSETSLIAADGVNPGNWYKPYAGTSGTLNSGKFYAVSLESLGGMDFFKKTDDSRYAITMNSASGWFGQRVSLEAGKTYVFSNCYSGSFQYQKVCYPDQTAIDCQVIYDNDWFSESRKFTVPADAPDDGNGKKLIYVGVQGYKDSNNTLYYYDFKLYDVENPDVNLFEDYALQVNGLGLNVDVIKTPSGNNVNQTYVSEVAFSSIEGGINVFKKTDADRYVLKRGTDSAASHTFGQKVALEAGKTYIFSNYYKGTYNYQEIVYGDGSFTKLTNQSSSEDYDWFKGTFKFTVPEEAPDDGNGKKLIWVGISGYKNTSEVAYYYDFRLYDIENPELNLLADNAFVEGGTSFNTDIWKSGYDTPIKTSYTKATLESAGGMDIFKKPYNILVMNTTVSRYFGQNVILEAGKKYSYSFYYEAGKIGDVVLLDGNDYEGVDKETLKPTVTFNITNIKYDDEYNKVTYEFIAPEDATSAGEGKVRIYLGLRKKTEGVDYHFYGFDVHAVDDKEKTNLFTDSGFNGSDTLYPSDSSAGIWHTPYTTKLYNDSKGKLSIVTLDSKGGLDFFKKTDADRYAIRLEPKTKNQPYFGQRVSLEAGKTYIYTNYYLADTPANLQACYADSTVLEAEIINDTEWSKQSIKFTVPADAPDDGSGKKLIWVGLRGNERSFAQYYYGFELYDIDNPEVNLLNDFALQLNGLGFNVDAWKTPSGNNVNWVGDVYSEVSLESIGGMNRFFTFEKKCNVNEDQEIDICDLVRMNEYHTNAVESLPDGTGDLDNNESIADLDDMLRLKAELLK